MRFLLLVPWKPVVLVWGLLTAMILIAFTTSSLLQGTDHSLGSGAAGSAKTAGAAHAGQQKHSQKAAQNPSH